MNPAVPVASLREPLMTCNADGTVSMTLPDPCADAYPVAVELLHEWVAVINENVALREALATALEYADHSPGCNGPHGYRCKCLWAVHEPELRTLVNRDERSMS